jgi:thiamine pyrophosphate-dependent acetolactate synthase large subunit-like protein
MTAKLKAADWQTTPWCGGELLEQLAHDRPYPPFRDLSGSGTVDIRAAMVRLDQLLPPDRSVVTDVGRFAATAWRYLRAAHPSRFAHTANFASIGLGLGNAIGAAFAHPATPTVCVAGDGGFMMNLSEFATAVRNQLPLVVIVVNDGAYGAEYDKLRSHGFDPALCFSQWPDLADVSRAMGGRGITVRTLADLDAITGALTAPVAGPLLVDVRMDPGLDIDLE